ncbi:unnamed protein product [Cyprideis torosa]|uniref:Uncharacterized protein n=1 Tax=Cyprideis torosa TaxID=163714 RepID=A0A7R8ZJF4_9CRUS|nr:unnamed protein product [Cyprideis torosa]CAG0886857.1 unnamed protein product [Cyprideis torosa]
MLTEHLKVGRDTTYEVLPALRSLESIGQHVGGNPHASPIEHAPLRHAAPLRAPIVHLKRLLRETQAELRRMVEGNKLFQDRLLDEIGSAQEGVSVLRQGLADANIRLQKMATGQQNGDPTRFSGPTPIQQNGYSVCRRCKTD